MMKMNENNQRAEEQGTSSVVTSTLLRCSRQSARHGMKQIWQDLLGRVFLIHTPWR